MNSNFDPNAVLVVNYRWVFICCISSVCNLGKLLSNWRVCILLPVLGVAGIVVSLRGKEEEEEHEQEPDFLMNHNRLVT